MRSVHVTVPMVQVGVMRVRAAQRRMVMPMRVRLTRGVVRPMLMLVVFVVEAPVLVVERVMQVIVVVTLRQMADLGPAPTRASRPIIGR
jgi:hypothetical protein